MRFPEKMNKSTIIYRFFMGSLWKSHIPTFTTLKENNGQMFLMFLPPEVERSSLKLKLESTEKKALR
ncbi:hypothetical protein YH66_05115 [[Brevibacterium] flavum]|uniref:Uncharacterized protein n=1 Tax=[Brevibacterium] flavum TaxID=92706 RepID=A0A0F6WQ93_9CORY|nr:hypothetical protein YH66_05115 [[Brevibacterium] flavum]ANE07801.1 hypothetical protein A3654_05105 [Corynebacterium glutamicum]AST20216.1 hypothetical protein CEY17_05170 [Corynebacterium glutamicum ATCC 14067]KEI22690.1 hypothetical protein KIQ_008930 [Corynebacterium glutamicum ATCC 14067]KIH74238.1 hypothetical protein SD36_05140 [Corynebacterium glutamicum]